MALPLMPKATAVWLIDNTALTFEQIAEFSGLHTLEIQAIADGDVATGIVGRDPIANGQLNAEEIKRCEASPKARLQLLKSDTPAPKARGKGARYTPVSKRSERPDAIAWLIKMHPELSDAQIRKLLGTTKQTINAIRDKTHWNSANIKSRNPVTMGLCTEADLEKAVIVARGDKKVVESHIAPRDEKSTPTVAEPAVEPVVEEVKIEETAESVFKS